MSIYSETQNMDLPTSRRTTCSFPSHRTQASKSAVNLDYLSYLRDAVVRPLSNLGTEGVPGAITFMDSYCLMKEDVDNIMEVTSWSGKPSAFSKLDSKVTHCTGYYLTNILDF